MTFRLSTPAFAEGGPIPELHTCEGANLSPALEWSGEPPAALSFALVMEDPDAPGGIWTHWLLAGIPLAVHSLPQGFKPGSLGVSGVNDFGRPGYGGPCPPRGHGPHRYFFRLMALDITSLGVKPGVRRRDFDNALRGHVLAEAVLMGRYERH